MVYQAGSLLLEEVQEVFTGKVNDIVICRAADSPAGIYYTVHIMKEHKTAKKVFEVFEQEREKQEEGGEIECFSWKGHLCFLFPYERERSLFRFFSNDSVTLRKCEELCLNLLVECIKNRLPHPILFQILKQKQLNIMKDYSLHFGYQIDFAEFDADVTENDCVRLCANIILWILEQVPTKNATSYALIEKKISKQGYSRFTELFHDIKMVSVPKEKAGLLKRVKSETTARKDTFFRILLVVCVVLLAVALILMLSKLIFGDIPFLRLFMNGFEKIGTESMLQ